MDTHHNDVKLTAAELSQIWGAYQNDTLSKCFLQYFSAIVEDPDIQAIIQHGLKLSQSHIAQLTDFFKVENYPVPHGFTDNDVNVGAPRLYSDSFILYYMHQLGKLGINAYSVAVALAVRSDIHTYFSECLSEFTKLHKMTTDLLLNKGLYIRTPHLPTPEKAEFVNKQSFLTGWFGNRRTLVSLEVTNLHDNIQRNALGVSTLIGFSQVANSKQVRQYMVRGKEIAAKHVEIFGSILREDNLPVPMSWDMEVTDSTTSPFSDKLMMFLTTGLIASGMGYYGTSMATTMRRDIQTHYARLTSEIGKYAEDGANILIDNGWMEYPPKSADRDKLANHKS